MKGVLRLSVGTLRTRAAHLQPATFRPGLASPTPSITTTTPPSSPPPSPPPPRPDMSQNVFVMSPSNPPAQSPSGRARQPGNRHPEADSFPPSLHLLGLSCLSRSLSISPARSRPLSSCTHQTPALSGSRVARLRLRTSRPPRFARPNTRPLRATRALILFSLANARAPSFRFSRLHPLVAPTSSQTVADVIRTCLGPKAMLKMILDPMGGILFVSLPALLLCAPRRDARFHRLLSDLPLPALRMTATPSSARSRSLTRPPSR